MHILTEFLMHWILEYKILPSVQTITALALLIIVFIKYNFMDFIGIPRIIGLNNICGAFNNRYTL